MGRELKRKQAKKEGRNVKEIQAKKQEVNQLKPKSLLIILGFVVGFFVILYFITAIFITKDISFGNKDSDNSESNSADTIYNRILAVDTLKQMEDEYYVFYYDSSDDNTSISSRVDILPNKVYRVDLSDSFNDNYVGTASGIVDDISDLRVENPSIVKVSMGKIIEFYSGSEEVNSILD